MGAKVGKMVLNNPISLTLVVAGMRHINTALVHDLKPHIVCEMLISSLA